MPRAVKCYYWRDVPNFGDVIGASVLRVVVRLKPRWTEPEDAAVITAGSILSHMPVHWRGTVLGSGLLQENGRVPLAARYLAVRGPLTARAVGVRHAVLGDPGLLATELVRPESRVHNLGLLPHWTDRDLTSRPEFLKYNPLIISPSGSPEDVSRQISSCKKLVTSSLHGAIVADAFGVPRRIEMPPARYQHASEKGDFKFRDYHASIGMKFQPGVTSMPVAGMVQDRQHELYDLFREYGRELRRRWFTS